MDFQAPLTLPDEQNPRMMVSGKSQEERHAILSF